MDTTAILSTCIGSLMVAVLALTAHRRLAGSGERAGWMSMIAFAVAWLAGLTGLLTGLFLLAGRSTR